MNLQMLHVLTKKPKSKSRSQRGELSQATNWGGLSPEIKSTTPDFIDQRKFRCGDETSAHIFVEDRRFRGSMRTRSSSSRRSCSAVVTFESIKPTQIWQASASPSPPTSTVKNARRKKPRCPTDSLALSMIAHTSTENQWLSLSTGDEDDLSDSTDDDDEDNEGQRMDCDHAKRVPASKSHQMASSNSSSDSSSSFETARSSTKSARHRRKKQSSRRLLRGNATFSSGSSSASSDSSSSSSSECENEFDICWKLKSAGGLRNTPSIQPTPQLKRAPNHQHHQPPVLRSMGTPQITPRYPSIQQYKRPQTLNLASIPFPRPLSSQNSSTEAPFVQMIAKAIEDFFPTSDWIEKYKVIIVHRGDLLKIMPYPGTSPDKTSSAAGWFLAQKWCPDHRSGTGPIGFVPRVVCSFVCPESTPTVRDISPRRSRSQDYTLKMSEAGVFITTAPTELIQASTDGQITVASSISDTASEPVASRGLYPSPQLSLHTPSTTAAKTSFTSIPAVYEIEDRDSGRGPSSGSEWSSGKGGSLSGATDINLDEKDQLHSVSHQQSSSSHISSSLKWSPNTSAFQRRASLDQHSGSKFSSPLPPPPMALLSNVCSDTLGNQKPTSTTNTMSASDTEAGSSLCSTLGTRNRLYVRGSKLKSVKGKLVVEGNIHKAEEKSGDSPFVEALSGEVIKDQEEEEGETSGSFQSTVMVVSSNSDPAHWEPYKTMIQVGQNKLEKFTLV